MDDVTALTVECQNDAHGSLPSDKEPYEIKTSYRELCLTFRARSQRFATPPPTCGSHEFAYSQKRCKMAMEGVHAFF